MERSVGNPADAVEFEDLHTSIEDGDLEAVRRIVESHSDEIYFSFEDTSALYKAFDCQRHEIISFLIYKGAKFLGFEEKYVYNFEIDLDRLNYLLYQYNKKSEKSCVYKLMATSQSPRSLDGEKLNALVSMYEHLFRSDINRLLMTVLEREPFDIVYDFESDKVNRIHRVSNKEEEVYGLTLTTVGEIFVGAKNLLSGDPRKRAKVYGVVAEELCHLALTIVFKNDAKPYREEDSKLIKEFLDIVSAVRSFTFRSCHVESVIEDVYRYYNVNEWECELIARVPHIIGIYGEDDGRKVLQGSSELCRLLKFYDQNVQKKCKLYSDPSVHTKSHREMEELVTKDFISYKEKQIYPLKENFQSFKTYLVEWGSTSIITTNCTRLCMLHVYHELKKEFDFLLEKECLFFSRKCFEKNVRKIGEILRNKLWQYLILVMDKRELNLSGFRDEYLDLLEEYTTNGMKLIMISSNQSADQKFDFEKAVNYRWNDLSEAFKTTHQSIKYQFKGEEDSTFVGKEYFPKVFDDADISMILSGEVIEVDDGDELFSQGYVTDTYVERVFYTTVVDGKIFKTLSPDVKVLLSGWKKGEHRVSPFDNDLVQWLQGDDVEIQMDKSIFVVDKARPIGRSTTKDFAKKTSDKKIIWLQYDDNEFYMRWLNSSDDVFRGHFTQKTLTEKEMLKFLKKKRILLISDNAGYGKSTAMSSLIDKLKKTDFSSWNWRINFNKFSGNENDCLSLANIEEKNDEDVLDHLFLMLGLKNSFEKHLFWECSKGGHCFIFFDGFDEIPSQYVNKAVKLLSAVRENTFANLVVSTRKHHQLYLELLLNTYSFQLVPFSRRDQLRYLDKLWKCRLSFPTGRGTGNFLKDGKKVPEKIKKIIEESKKGSKTLDKDLKDLIVELEKIDLRGDLESVRRKIKDLNFNKIAETVIESTSLDREILEFMGVPLHLFMTGVIYFYSNFNVEIQTDIYSIYSKFIEQKILLYVEEKQGFSPEGRVKKYVIERETTEAYRIHTDLANQFLDAGRYDNNLSEEDLEVCTELGIVFIRGAEINFLHSTFAEFFKAEYVREKMNRISLTGVLFDDKYKVVRRFLSSSLERNNFENLSEGAFEDLDFLSEVLEWFVDNKPLDRVGFADSNFHLSHIAKIAKCLAENVENRVGPDLMEEFERKLEPQLSSSQDWYCVGGCLPFKTLKKVLDGNVKMIFGAVKYYSNPKEVIDLLSECISIQMTESCGAKDEEKRKTDSVSRILKFVDSNGKSFFDWAVWNVNAEIFARILEFLRDILGKERFVDEIIRGEDFRKAMDEFMEEGRLDRIIPMLKVFHTVFDDEMEMFFSKSVILMILECSLWSSDDWKNEFEKVINLSKECFGIENLKESFLICDDIGRYLIHYLASDSVNVTDNLNMIRDTLADGNKLKQCLMFKASDLKNVFHFVRGNKSFREILQFCVAHLDKCEIEGMLESVDAYGQNVVHVLFESNPTERIVENLNLMEKNLGDKRLIRKLLMDKNKFLWNIFHFGGFNGQEINFSLLDSYLDKREIKDLLFEKNEKGKTCLHFAVDAKSPNLFVLLEYSQDIDESKFEDLIKARDENGDTYLHVLVRSKYFTEEFANLTIESVKEKVSDEVFRDLLRIRNDKGETMLHLESDKRRRVIEFFRAILDESFFEELWQKKENVVEEEDCKDFDASNDVND